ncbi:MAG: hypothetical protein ACKO14_04760 [Armatimonadota bacterium]
MRTRALFGFCGTVMLAIVAGCQRQNTAKQSTSRKPIDASKPLSPQLFPTPDPTNIWFHVIASSDELKFNAKLSRSAEYSDVTKSPPDQRARFFASEPAKSLVADLVSVSSMTATSPRSVKTLADSVIVPPDLGRFRTVTRFLTAAMVTASEQRDSRLATDIATTALKIAQAPCVESNAGISTSLACEMAILSELCRISNTLAPDDLEAIAATQLLPSALNKSRFTPGLRSDYAIIESLLASDDFVDVLASQMTTSSDEAVVRKKVDELQSNPDQVGISRLQVKMHARMCEQTLMHVVGQPMEFMRTKVNQPPKETYGIVETIQSFEGTNAANVITCITLERAAGLYLKAVAIHKRTGKWPRDIAAIGSGYDVVEPLTGKPYILTGDAAGDVLIRASKGMPVLFGLCKGELSVGKRLQLGNASK